MKVLDTNHFMSNAEVKLFIERKRVQISQEDKSDRAAGFALISRPRNLMSSLEKHGRHLDSDAYPYVRNPTAYGRQTEGNALYAFSETVLKRVQEPLVEKYKDAIREKSMSVPQAKRALAAEQEKKDLTQTELLMVYNHAPKCREMLEPMIENVNERFTREELEVVVDCIKDIFRPDEQKVVGQG